MKDRCAFVLWSKLFLELNLCPAVSLFCHFIVCLSRKGLFQALRRTPNRLGDDESIASH